MNCDVNYLHRADGSCLYSQGNTTVVASIDGPGDLKSSRQSVDSAVVQVVVKRSIGGSSAANAQVAYIIENLCYSAIIVKLFPKTLISIVVQELESDGCFLEASINAVCLALLNSGLPMFDTFAAVTIAILPQSEEIIPSPSSQIEESAECLMTAVFLHHHAGDLYGCWSRGLFTGDRLKRCVEKAHSISKTVFASFRQTAASSVAGKLSTSALSPSSSSG